jgi:hypothetical protein
MDTRVKSPHEPDGKLQFSGLGPDQPKPDRSTIGKTTVQIGGDLLKAQDQAAEALRQQRVAPGQRELVTGFYKKLNPPAKEPDKPAPPK